MSKHQAEGAALDRHKLREELQKELAELWAASKQSIGSSQHKETHHPTPDGTHRLESGRQSNEKRKPSTERKPSFDLDSSDNKGQPQGSHDSAAGLWHQQVPGHKCDEDVFTSGDAESTPCLRWLPFRAITATLRRHPSIWIITLLLFLALSTGGIIGVFFIAANETHQRRMSAEGFALNAAVAFERQLAQMFFPLLSLATIIRFDPYYPRFNKTFDSVAKELMDEMPTQGAVTNLIAAPQGVLRNFYPLSGYCQDKCDSLNINLFKDPERRPVALKTVQQARLMMQGPMMLSQGYFGVVGRQPVYISNSTRNETFGAPDGLAYNCSVCWNEASQTQFWGFVNAVINLQSLVNGNDSRLRDLRVSGYKYEMFKLENNGTHTEIARSQVLPYDPVQADVNVPGGLWYLQVSPEQGWVPVWRAPILAVVVLVCALFSLLLGAILVSNKLQAWLKTANEALAREKERMDVLLARQHNLISCVLQGEADGGPDGKHGSSQNRTLARIEDMRREIGVAQHTNGTTNGVDELQLIELIDEGTYGKVFKGLWRGSTVAVKTMVLPAKMSGAEKRERMAVMEAAISSSMQHPNIVQTYTYIIKSCSTSVAHQAAASEGSLTALTGADFATSNHAGNLDTPQSSSSTVHNFEVSLVLEFCDWGSLRIALDAGAFFAHDNSLNYAAILDTAADVARAMLHLHKNQVLHSDLKARNVLLKGDNSRRGCVAKVADFGLAVKMDCMDTHISAFQGTMSHLSPEALLHGHISKAADVYAFGVTMWELFTGGQAYQGIPRALVGHKVAVLGLRPTLPPFTPADYRTLVEDCWHQDPEKRPSFDIILARLVRMRGDLGIPVTPPLQRYQLRPKVSQEGHSSSEKGVDGVAADAQAQGLMHLGSFYVNMSQSSTAPPNALHSSNHQQQQLSMNGVRRSCDGGSGDSNDSNGSMGGNCNGSMGGNCNGSYRPAPRTQHLASRLYARSGNQLYCIPDTEDELEADAAAEAPQQQQQHMQQLDKQQHTAAEEATGPGGGSLQCNGSAIASSTSPAATAAGAAAAAADDACSITPPLPPPQQQPESTGLQPQAAAAAAAAGAAGEQRSQQMQRLPHRSGSSSCRTSTEVQRHQQQQQPPDIEQGRC